MRKFITHPGMALLSLLLCPLMMQAQWLPAPDHYGLGVATLLSEGRAAPFWLLSNREGKFLPENSSAAALDLSLFADPDTTRAISVAYGLELYGLMGSRNDFWIHQAYGLLRYKSLLHLRAGRWTEIVGSKEPELSTGSVIWSGNTRPMWKVEIATPGYIDVPLTRGYLEVKGLLSHGWFEADRHVKDVWMHHKNIYLRLGGTLPVNITYGFNHYAQWGGTPPSGTPYPSDLNAYYRIFFNRAGDPDDPATPGGWAINKFGNTLGSRNYGIDLNRERFKAGIYQQDVFEDGSGLRRQNFPDGLWGAYVRFTDERHLLQAVVYEFLHTKDQSGPTHDDPDGNVVGGNDNYFNHGHYRSGWTYFGFTIGTPLITSPILNDPASDRITNNRVLAHHVGIEGFFSETLSYRALATYSRNYGRHPVPFEPPIDQLSLMLELKRPLPWYGLQAGITVAADVGRMYGDNTGVIIHLQKNLTPKH